jgi:TfoX/Sxy family transcriptional regulator of competence genes
MGFPRASPWIRELFASLTEGLECDRRQMFGFPCAFVNGQMFSGVFGDAIFVRLSEEARARLLAQGGSVLDPMGGRPMKEYVLLADGLLEDEQAGARWLAQALTYARSLPLKASKKLVATRAAKKAPARKAAQRAPAKRHKAVSPRG